MSHQGDKELVEACLPIVADSWDQLRGCDVSRLLDNCMNNEGSLEDLDDYAAVIVEHRGDLEDRVEEAVEVLSEEWLEAQ